MTGRAFARALALFAVALIGLAGPAVAEEDGEPDESAAPATEAAKKPARKDEAPIALGKLLAEVRATAAAEKEQDQKREAEFQAARDALAEKVRRTDAQVRAAEAESASLDSRYGENEIEIETLGVRLTDRLGQMGELFGVVRLVSTDMSAQAWDSLTSLGLEERTSLLDRLGRSSDLPSTEDLEKLWYEVQREMTEQARVIRKTVPVIVEEAEEQGAQHETVQKAIVRVGPFTAFGEDGYVRWRRDAQKVQALDRQPPPRYVDTIEGYLGSDGGFQRVAVDPSRGVLLVALTDTPSMIERIQAGGYVGYTIIGLGLFALALGLVRLVVLTTTGRRVGAQVRSDRPDDGNPLGRILGVYEQNRNLDPEALEQRLDEAALHESTSVERHMWIVRTVSIIAPLLGLLGTVTGMIQTFQAITLFGAGDPKMMAGGISEALITTTLGLVIAIPLVLLHALLSSRARNITDVLDERVASLRAERFLEETSS